MSAIHMAIENAETILFLFQMAILSKVHGRVDMGGLSYYQNARTSEEQSRAKKLRSQSRQMSRKKVSGVATCAHEARGAYNSKSGIKLWEIINQTV